MMRSKGLALFSNVASFLLTRSPLRKLVSIATEERSKYTTIEIS